MNSIVTHYRAQFPDDQRTDDEITLAYAGQYDPEQLSTEYPDFGADYKRLIQAAFPPSVGDYAKQFVGSGIRGVTETVASGLESAAVLGREAGQRSVPQFDPSQKAEPFEEASGIPGLVRRAGEAVSPAPVAGLEKSFAATKLPSALGSTAGLAATALFVPESLIPRLAGVALMGAASGGVEGYKDALRHGSTAEQAATSGALNALVGTSEAWPLGRMLHRIDKMSGGTFGKALTTSVKEGFENAVQDAFQGVSGDIIAQNYDKNRKLFEDVASDAAAGGISGVVFSLLTSAIGAKLGRGGPATEGREEPSTPAAAPIVMQSAVQEVPLAQDVLQTALQNQAITAVPTSAPVTEELVPPSQELEDRARSTAIRSLFSDYQQDKQRQAAELAQLGAQIDRLPKARSAALQLGYDVPIAKAAAQTNLTPTDDQRASGEFEKGEVEIDGLRIAIENPKGTIRRGKTPDGKEWSVTMSAHYGEIIGTEGTEGDRVDVYIGPEPERDTVYVIDQHDPKTGAFNEHKTVIGAPSKQAAEAIYDAAFSDGSGPKRRRLVVALSKSQFKQWLTEDKRNAIAETGKPAKAAAPATFAGYDGTVATFTLTEPVGNHAAGAIVTQDQLKEAGYDVAPQLAAIRYQQEQLEAQRSYFEREIAELGPEIEASKAKPDAFGKLPRAVGPKINRLTFAHRKIAEIDARRERLGTEPIKQLYVEDVDTRDTHDVEIQSGRKVFASFYILGDGSESAQRLAEAAAEASGEALADQLMSGSSPKKGENKERTRRLTIFKAHGGDIAVLGTYRLPKGDRVSHPTDPTGEALSLEEILKQGYKPIGSIRLVFPLNQPAYRFPNLATFKAEFGDDALTALKGSRATAVAVEEDLKLSAVIKNRVRIAEQETGTEVDEEDVGQSDSDDVRESEDASEAFPTEESEKFRNLPGLSNALFSAIETYLTDKAGKRDNLDNDNWDIAIEDAVRTDSTLRNLIVRAGNGNKIAITHLHHSAYEAYKQVEGIAEAEERLAAFQAALGAKSGVDEADSTAAFRLVSESARATGRGYSDPAGVAARFSRVIDALRARGQDVLLFQRRLGSLFTDIAGPEAAGFIAPKFNTIVLALEDLQNPSHFTVRTALHEAVEFEARALPDEMRARLHAAVQQLGDDALGISNAADPRARLSNPAGLPPDQLVRELLAERLATRGISDATGLAARLWRFVKGIYLRVSMALQQTLFGQQAVRPETILAWWDNHMENFVNGTLGESLLAWFGGGRLTVAGQLRAYESVGPGFMPVEVLDWRREQMTYADLVPETLEAMLLNAEFQKAPRRSDPEEPSGENDPTSRVTIDVAANNEVDAALQGMNAVWTGKGLNTMGLGTYEDFATEILQINPGHLPQAKIAAVNLTLSNNGHAPANPTARVTSFTSGTYGGEAAVKGLKALQGLRHRMGRRRGVSQALADRDDATLKRNNAKLSAWSNKKSGLDLLFNYASQDIKTLLRDFKSDMREQGKLNRKYGALLQAVKDLQERRDDPVSADQEKLIEGLAAKITKESQSFMDTLRAVAQLNIDWQNTPLYNLGGTIGIRELILTASSTNPALKPLQDQPGLLAIVASFARTNDALMTLLVVRESQATQDAEAIRKMIEQAFSDTSQDLQETRRKIATVVSLKAEATKLFEHIRAVRLENDRLVRDIQRNKAFVAAHDATRGELDSHLSRLQKFLGVGDPVYFYHGEMIPVPQRPGATLDEIENERRADSTEKLHWVRFQQYDDNGRQAASLDANLNRIRAWLNANPQHEGSALYRKLEDAERGLKMLSADTRHYGLKRSLLGSVLGSIATLAENTGTASGRRAGERIRKHVAISQGYADDLRKLGIKIGELKGDAKTALGIKDDETFYDLFYDGPLSLLESNKALNEAANPMAARLAAIRQYLTSNTATAHALTNPKAWPALEKFYLASAGFSAEMVKVKSAMGVLVKDDVLGLFRESIGDPLSTMQRSFRPDVATWIKAMAPLWNGSQRLKLTEQFVMQQLVNDPQGFARDLKERFTPEVWEQFLKPLANHPGRSLFSGKTVAGQWTLANRADVIDAFRNANGDILQFALGLKANTGATVADEAFIAETLGSLQNYFNAVNTDMSQHAAIRNPEGLATLGIMNARSAEWAPPEWLRYARFDQNYARYATIRLAYHAAFGVNGEAILHDFAAARMELEDVMGRTALVRKEIAALYPGRSKEWLDRQLKIELKKRKLDVEKHLSAESHLANVQTAHSKFNAWFENQGDGQVEMRGFMEALHTVTGLMVQGPKTVLIDTTTMFNSLLTLGPNKLALQQIRNNWAHFASNAFGSLFQTIGITSHWNLDMALRRQDAGLNDISLRVPWRERVAAIRASDKSYLVQIARIARETLTQATAADIPVLGRLANRQGPFAGLRLLTAMFTQGALWMHHALIESNWKTFDDLVLRAVRYLEANPALIGRKDVNLTMADLKYSKRLGIFSDERAFLYMKEALQRHGMTVEGVANEVIARRRANPNDRRIFTREQDMSLASLAVSELASEGNISNNPTFLYNPALRASALLLAWSFRRVEALRTTWREPSGEWSYRALLNGASVMMALLPIGLAYAFLMDEFDEEITGKKSNIRGFGQDSNGLAALEQLSRMGMFGLWGDLGNTIGNFAGEGDLRGLSIDNRVVWVNSMLNIFRTLGTYLRQGEATYSTVYRPMLQAIGGSGYMQIAQIINNTLDLDNPESRVTRRINAQNYLRAAGRELQLDVRGGRGGSFSLPNSIKPHVSEMVLAALADDQAGFYEAFRDAVEAAREEKKEDPTGHVKDSFASYHPFRSVFRTPPSDREYRQILSVLPADGQQDVSEAVVLFERYGTRLGLKPISNRAGRPIARPQASAIRSRALAF